MNLLVNDINIFIIVLVTFMASVLLVPVSKKIAHHVGAIDMPDERKVHTKPMPRLGGLAIFGAFLLGYILFGDLTVQMVSILIGGFIIVLMGFIDDIKPIRARYKFLVQLVAATIAVFYGGLEINYISFFGYSLDFITPINYLVTVIFIVAIANAINLIDGLDGLAAGVSSIYFTTIAVITLILNLTGGLSIVLTLVMLGATLGFLLYNFNPASIFMGDSGSLFLGYMIAVISLLNFKTAAITSLIVPILILSIPILDTLFAILRRLIKKQSIGTPDKEHLHHQFLKMKFSKRVTVLVIYMINIMFSVVSVLFVTGYNEIAVALYVVLMIGLLFMVLKTNLLFDNKK